MTQATLSQATLAEANRLAHQAHTWHTGTSKRDGRPFFVIPSRTEPSVAHWTTSYGCTCKGFRKHGDCAHAEAVRMHEAWERMTTRPIKTYEDIYGLEDAF